MPPDIIDMPTVTKKSRKAKVIYKRMIVQTLGQAEFRVVEDLGETTTLKANQAKKRHEKCGEDNLAVIYWVG